ncbi:putative transcriptional regulatory protein [Cladobotryum mycophilum]|uniref:Transcriptional regulatory protein n=1 Tax=Cladobotryum mycophilum TaxID=491253 RepID=A0ABR0S4D2_9HYPO
MENAHLQTGSVRYIRSRIANACDECKRRKVKCDGKIPCGYCAARQRPETCRYSLQKRRRQTVDVQEEGQQQQQQQQQQKELPRSPPSSVRESTRSRARSIREPSVSASPTPTPASIGGSEAPALAGAVPGSEARRKSSSALDHHRHHHHHHHHHPQEASVVEDETEVPREARLLCDAHGKLTFIGDCAPLSFFQSVRRLVTAKTVPDGSILPPVRPIDVTPAVSSYLCTTASLIDLFDNAKLVEDLLLWANLERKPNNVTSIVYFLVLAIGLQIDNDELSQEYFEYARDQAYTNLSDSLSVEVVQAFVLITIYMLCSCQINGAFLFFGIAVRAAYSIGLHRTEVNARFGLEIHKQRDRLWKSLRVVDLFLSSSMGRPPATSDVDCTVPYRTVDADGNEVLELMNASVQILLILECVILEIYSRRKISMQLTEGISLQLRDWSGRWLRQLKDVIAQPIARSEAQVIGACQVLSSYYYAVMLVSRPFLMYELCRRLAEGSPSSNRSTLTSGRSKLADACIDAASLMVEPILELIERNVFKGKAPLLVSWLFASSLVLGVGLLGGFGRILEKYTKMSIRAMNHFAENDAHARQYSLIAQSLLTTALEYLERQELQERLRRTENSSQLFGLVPFETRSLSSSPTQQRGVSMQARSPEAARNRLSLDRSLLQHQGMPAATSPRLGDIDTAFLSLSESVLHTPDSAYWTGLAGNEGDPSSALNLFPLLEAGGGIDLAHWFGGGSC